MTPRQFAAFFFLAKRRHRIEQAELLGHLVLAYRAEPKDLKQSLKALLDDAE